MAATNKDQNPTSKTTLTGMPADMGGSVVDRRSSLDRRDHEKDSGDSGVHRRRGPGRRRSDYLRAAEEGDMTQEQFMFLMAINEFKIANNCSFPSWTDVLEVIRLLGYRKTMASEIKMRSTEDWRESADAPSCVRPDSHTSTDDPFDQAA